HERLHLRRGDLYANLLAALLLCIGWCNPLMHLAWRAFRLDQEPVSVGLWRPRIVLPMDFDTRYSAAERTLILAHERLHLRRGDL
ncbi:M56 family metallopeptidase, partial [Xanthomonas citri pv. citri]